MKFREIGIEIKGIKLYCEFSENSETIKDFIVKANLALKREKHMNKGDQFIRDVFTPKHKFS